MKYTREQIESHFKWAANNEAPMANKWIDWCAKSIFIIQELLEELTIQEYRDDKCERTHINYISELEAQNERYRAALELIRDNGGKQRDAQLISTNGTWCADQADWALKGEE